MKRTLNFKYLAAILILLVSISLSACARDKAVVAAEEAIAAIGEVTLESGDLIEAADTAYNQLDDKQKQSVKNAELLTQSAEKYEEIKEQHIKDHINELLTEGLSCLHGSDGNQRDLNKSLACFEEAAGLGDMDACFMAGWILDNELNESNGQDYAKASEYYTNCMDSNPYARISEAYFYKNGMGKEKDEDKAEALFEEAAKEIAKSPEELEGKIYIAEACFLIGEVYYDGNGVDQDYAKAMEWFTKAADLGNASAMRWIGYMYHFGEGVEVDYAKAMDWYSKAADLGDSTAMIWIGSLYENGEGVEVNYAKAMEWYIKAADLGYDAAMNNIGFLYQNGFGVDRDYAKAMEWYSKAADLGDAVAMNNIGTLYHDGLGVDQDYAKAMEWFLKSVDAGGTDYTIMNNIAKMYENGFGVEVDYAKAREWRDKAE